MSPLSFFGVTFVILVFGIIGCLSEKPAESQKITVITEDQVNKDLDKRSEWGGLKAAWGKRDDMDDEIELDLPSRDIRADWDGLRSAWGKRADWQGLKSAWGKRSAQGWQGLQSAWGKRDWKGLQSAWGKRASDWKGLQSAWGKRGGDWSDEYAESIQRQMEAMKNRRSNWQSLASWGRR